MLTAHCSLLTAHCSSFLLMPDSRSMELDWSLLGGISERALFPERALGLGCGLGESAG